MALALAPLPRGFSVSPAIQSSRSPCRASPSLEQCFSPRASAFGFGNHQQSFSQAMPQSLSSPFVTPEMRDRIDGSLSQPVAESTAASDPVSFIYGSSATPGETNEDKEDKDTSYATEEFWTDQVSLSCAPPTDIWEILDREEQLFLHSDYSTTSVMKTPFSQARHLRKERSLICSQKLFSLSTVSIPQKLRKKPKSVTALKCASYAEPIVDLPRGLKQMGSGIGYTCAAPPRTPSALKNSAATGYALDPGTRTTADATRASISSDFTVAVPQACHGLIHSLSMSNLWTGFKSHGGSLGPPTASASSPGVKDVTEVPNLVSESFSATGGSLLWKKDELSEEMPSGMLHPLAESTAIVSPSQGTLSSSGMLSITSSTASEEGVLTPDTVEFPQQDVVCDTAQERSEKMFGLEPESTLRLVTPFPMFHFSLRREE
jgi:serum/glucocorticoid-regulated kinase 2